MKKENGKKSKKQNVKASKDNKQSRQTDGSKINLKNKEDVRQFMSYFDN